MISISLAAYSFVGTTNTGQPNLQYKFYTLQSLSSASYKIYGIPKLGYWAAKLVLTNSGTSPAYNVKIVWSIPNYVTSVSHNYPVLLPGSTVVDLFYPFLPASVTNQNTATPSSINFEVDYSTSQNPSDNSQTKQVTDSKPVSILGRNDFIFSSIPADLNEGTYQDFFSNYQLVAAFVTPADPVVQQYAGMANKLAGGAASSLSDEDAIKSLKGIWDLSVYNGIQYKTEPNAFWTGQQAQLLYYARDTLKNKIGTCIDTSIFISSMAEALGLKTYIYLIPGHAFPVVVLPISHQIVPIESTLLNKNVPFANATDGGYQSYQNAMNGPLIVVNVEALQSAGISPPELPALSDNTLTQWGISTPQTQAQAPNQNQTPTQNQPQATVFKNQNPNWSLSVPIDWTSNRPDSNDVVFTSPQGSEIDIGWTQGITAQNLRGIVETRLQQVGQLQLAVDNQTKFAGVTANVVAYTYLINNQQLLIVARYFDNQGYAFAVVYAIPNTADVQQNITLMETQLVNTFTLG